MLNKKLATLNLHEAFAERITPLNIEVKPKKRSDYGYLRTM